MLDLLCFNIWSATLNYNTFIYTCPIKIFIYLCRPASPKIARMAELVDALVSNTSGCKAVPVRSRLRVQKKRLTKFKFCWPLFLLIIVCIYLIKLKRLFKNLCDNQSRTGVSVNLMQFCGLSLSCSNMTIRFLPFLSQQPGT